MALETLVGRWQDRLWRHAARLCEDEQAAWDALQEAWIAMAKGIHRLQDPRAFPAWAYRITSNKCRDGLRREARRRALLHAYHAETPAVSGPHPAENPALSLTEALAQLNGPDQAILSLYYLDGFSVADVAEILHLPAGTVKSRLFHARQRLRNHLEDPTHD